MGLLRALRHRNYRLFFGGQLVSLVGTWMTTTATAWLVYRLTGSAFLLGVVGFASQAPAFLLSPAAGLLVDRASRHKILLATQSLAMVQSLALAALILSGNITIPRLLALSVFQGMINAFDMPARQAFVIEMIEDKQDLGNAIALNSSMFNAARLVGPSLGGMVIAALGEGWCFLIDGVSYLAVIAALLAMKMKAGERARSSEDALKDMREGWEYALRSKPIRTIILLLALASLAGTPYMVLMPIYAGNVLGGGPHTLGFLMTAAAGGALLGALWLASRKSVLGLGRAIPIATATFGLGVIAFASSRALGISLVCLAVAGAGFMVLMGSCNTILQTIVDDDKRGRVMSIFIMAFLGASPLGSLLAGALSEKIGPSHTLHICGLLCLGGAFWFYRQLPEIRQAVRPIYVRMGILPELAEGIQTAAQLSTLEHAD